MSKAFLRSQASGATSASPDSSAAEAARPWLLYLLECSGGKLYAGISPDIEARFAAHCAGAGARYTRANRPLRILAAQPFPTRSAASVAEYRLKQLSRDEKLAWAQAHRWGGAAEPRTSAKTPRRPKSVSGKLRATPA